jgi:hypothetical protein
MWQQVQKVEIAGTGCFEDRAGVCGSMAWILDGASAVSEQRITDAESDALWMVDSLDADLKVVANEPVPLDELVKRAIQRTAMRAEHDWNARPEVPPSAALGVIRRLDDRTEFLVLADVSIILRTDAGVFEYTDQRVDDGNHGARHTMIDRLAAGGSFKQAFEQARPYLAENRLSRMNRPDGYWVASIDDHAVRHALTGALDGVREAILASDGFMRVRKPFKLIPDVAALFDPSTSLEEWATAIRQAESNDPDTSRYPRWRVADDICAQRVRWTD